MTSPAVLYSVGSNNHGHFPSVPKSSVKPNCALLQNAVNDSRRNVTFLLMLPWGGTAVASLPLLEIPVLTKRDVHQLKSVDRGRRGERGRLPASSEFHEPAVGLYVSGSFILSFAASRIGLDGGAPAVGAATSKLRVVLQQWEVHASSFVPLEKIVGFAAAAAIAVSKDVRGAEASSVMTEEDFLEAPLCSLWLLLRLPGGKGGFGALLKKQQRKKRANFSIDACRDLTGRRIRQAQVVTHIKAWMEKKRKEEALVAVLAQDAPEKLPEAKPEVSLDAAFISQQLASVAEMPYIVASGLKQQKALREKEEAEQRSRATAPQNRALYSQLLDAVELDSDDEQWSDMEAGNESSGIDQDSGGRRNTSTVTGSATSKRRTASSSTPVSCSCMATASPSSSSSRIGSSRSGTGNCSNSSSSKDAPSQPSEAVAAAQAMLQQLDQMRQKAASVKAAERKRGEASAAELAKAKAEAEKAAAEAAERVTREAHQLDVSCFNTAEELAKAVDEAVVKEKLKQLGWKCGGRPEERAARLMQLKTVDLSNVPKALLARQAVRRG